MEPLNVREYAESLRIAGNKWAPDIIEALDFIDSPELETLETIEKHLKALVPPECIALEPFRIAEWVSARLETLETIEKHLKDRGLRGENIDLDDAVRIICEMIDL